MGTKEGESPECVCEREREISSLSLSLARSRLHTFSLSLAHTLSRSHTDHRGLGRLIGPDTVAQLGSGALAQVLFQYLTII